MKNFFNVTHKNSAKAVAYIIIFFAFAAFAAFLIGCGNDNPVNNTGGNNPVPVFKIDSLTLHSFAPGSTDTTYNFDFNADLDSFKVSFTVGTNTPGSLSSLFIGFTDSGMALINQSYTESELNGTYVYNRYSQFSSCRKYITAILTVNGNGNVDKYMYVKNFTVLKIN